MEKPTPPSLLPKPIPQPRRIPPIPQPRQIPPIPQPRQIPPIPQPRQIPPIPHPRRIPPIPQPRQQKEEQILSPSPSPKEEDDWLKLSPKSQKEYDERQEREKNAYLAWLMAGEDEEDVNRKLIWESVKSEFPDFTPWEDDEVERLAGENDKQVIFNRDIFDYGTVKDYEEFAQFFYNRCYEFFPDEETFNASLSTGQWPFKVQPDPWADEQNWMRVLFVKND